MMKANMKRNFDVRHMTHALDPLPPGQQVWISGRRDSGVVVEQSRPPRSYIVSTPNGDLRRNRRHLTMIPHLGSSDTSSEQTPQPEIAVPTESTTSQTTRSGRVSVPPKRLIADPQWNS